MQQWRVIAPFHQGDACERSQLALTPALTLALTLTLTLALWGSFKAFHCQIHQLLNIRLLLYLLH